MGFLILVGLLLSSAAKAVDLPVDIEIAKLHAKALQLETLKEAFTANHCTVQFGNNTVAITAGALRSEGLVMAIGPNFPGQYLAYHQAPKPEQLAQIVEYTLRRNGTGEGVAIVSSHLEPSSPSATSLDTLVTAVAVPYLVPETEGLWMYSKKTVRVSLPKNKEHVEVSATGPSNTKETVSCN